MNTITPWLDVRLAIYRYRYQMHRCYHRCIIFKLENSDAPQKHDHDVLVDPGRELYIKNLLARPGTAAQHPDTSRKLHPSLSLRPAYFHTSLVPGSRSI